MFLELKILTATFFISSGLSSNFIEFLLPKVLLVSSISACWFLVYFLQPAPDNLAAPNIPPTTAKSSGLGKTSPFSQAYGKVNPNPSPSPLAPAAGTLPLNTLAAATPVALPTGKAAAPTNALLNTLENSISSPVNF